MLLPGQSCRRAGRSRRGAHGAAGPSACPSGAGSPPWGQRQHPGSVQSLPTGDRRPLQAQEPAHLPTRPAKEGRLGAARGRGALTAGSVSRPGSGASPGACGPAGPPSGPEAPSPGGPASLQGEGGKLRFPRHPALTPTVRPSPDTQASAAWPGPDAPSLPAWPTCPLAVNLSHLHPREPKTQSSSQHLPRPSSVPRPP